MGRREEWRRKRSINWWKEKAHYSSEMRAELDSLIDVRAFTQGHKQIISETVFTTANLSAGPEATKANMIKTTIHQQILQPFYSSLDFVRDYPHELNQKGKTKTNLDFLEEETVSVYGIRRTICKSAQYSRQITMLASHHSVFTGRMTFLSPNQQRESTV